MAKDYSSLDHKLELQNMVSEFCFVAKKEDNEIDKLLASANMIFNEVQLRERLEILRFEIENLKEIQQLLKRNFTEMATKLSRAEEDPLLAMQEIEGLSEKQALVLKEREALEKRLLSNFPIEILCCKKDTNQEASTLYEEDNHVDINTNFSWKRANETPWSWQILQGLENESHNLRPWSLTRVMMKMYGFKLEKAKKEALALESESHKDLTRKNFMDEALWQNKANLGALLQTISAITKSGEYDREVREAREVMIEWVYRIEEEIFFLAVDLLLLASTCNQNAALKLQESLRLKLDALKRRKGGRVLVVVYRILTLLEGKMLNGSAILEDDKDKIVHCKDKKEKEVLSNIHQVLVIQLYKMILSLTSVLYANIGLSCLNLSKKEALIGSGEIVERCDGEWRAIRAKIDEANNLKVSTIIIFRN